MRVSTIGSGILSVALAVSPAVLAQAPEKRFAVRAGLAASENSGASLIDDGSGTLQIFEADGGESTDLGFEWYLSDLVGVELLLSQAEYDVELETATLEQEVGDIEAMSVQLAVNFHVLRTRRCDLSAGFSMGRIDYDELEFEVPRTPTGGGTPIAAIPLEEDFALGVQSTLDINFGKNWAAFVGLRYQESQTSTDSFDTPSINVPFNYPVDPFSLRVGGTYRFGER